ncbi:MAG TPA: hypothetical protein VF544_20530 [Pyrinomonadaceae bacterium]
MRRRIIAPGLMLVLVLTSLAFQCGGGGGNNSNSDPKRRYVKALDDMAGGINAMIKAKRQLAQSGRLSRDEELRLTNQLLTANNAVTAAFNMVKSLTTVDATNKQQLVQLFAAVTTAINDLGTSLPTFGNAEAKERLQKIFAGVTAALAIINTLQNQT